MQGFGNRDRRYTLKIHHGNTTHAIDFAVEWQGGLQKTDRRAIAVATSIWAIAQYGKEQNNAYSETERHLGAESCEALVQLHEALKGERFTGKVRAADGFCLMAFASHTGMISGVRQYEALDIVRKLA